MNGLIVGLGSIGRRHLTNLRRLLPDADITVLRHGGHAVRRPHFLRRQAAVRAHAGAGETASRDACGYVGGIGPQESRAAVRPSLQDQEDALALANRTVFGIDDALRANPEFAVIASPSAFHVETALALADGGVHLFVEKPLAAQLEGIDVLIERCRRRNVVLQVGYNFRFYRPLQIVREAIAAGHIGRVVAFRAEVGQYLPDWRPGADYRQTASARRELGGGALLELSHELDYARWLVGEVTQVLACVARVGDLEIDVEDLVEVILWFANGAVGNVHLDMLQRSPTRGCRVVGTDGTLTWEADNHRVRHFSAQAGRWSELHPASTIDRNAMYVDELQHFLRCVRGQATPTVTGEDGRRVVQIVQAAKKSSELQRAVAV